MLVKPVKLKIEGITRAITAGPEVVTPHGRVDSWAGYGVRRCWSCNKEEHAVVRIQTELETFYCDQCRLEDALLGSDDEPED